MAGTTESRDEATDSSADSAIESSEASIDRITKALVGIQSGSGTPIYSETINRVEIDTFINGFVSQESEIMDEAPSPTLLFNFSNDILILKTYDDRITTAEQASQGSSIDNPYYAAYYKGSRESVESKLQYNYNMTTGAVEESFASIFNNIVQELSPPRNSMTFAYDFKFSRNQNGSITTGSVRVPRTRTATTTGGGGY